MKADQNFGEQCQRKDSNVERKRSYVRSIVKTESLSIKLVQGISSWNMCFFIIYSRTRTTTGVEQTAKRIRQFKAKRIRENLVNPMSSQISLFEGWWSIKRSLIDQWVEERFKKRMVACNGLHNIHVVYTKVGRLEFKASRTCKPVIGMSWPRTYFVQAGKPGDKIGKNLKL